MVHTFNLNTLAWSDCYIGRLHLKRRKGKASLSIHLLHRCCALMTPLRQLHSLRAPRVKKRLTLKETSSNYCRKRPSSLYPLVRRYWLFFANSTEFLWTLAISNWQPTQTSEPYPSLLGKSSQHLKESVVLKTNEVNKWNLCVLKESALWIWGVELVLGREASPMDLSSSRLSLHIAPGLQYVHPPRPAHGDWLSDLPSHLCLPEEQMPRFPGSELGPVHTVTLQRGFFVSMASAFCCLACICMFKWAGGINDCLMTKIREELIFWLTCLPRWVAAGSSLLGLVTLFISRNHL